VLRDNYSLNLRLVMNKLEKDQLIKLAHAVADVARVETLKYFRISSLTVESKEDILFDPVTIADRRAEKAMRELIELNRPNDGILGEEYPPKIGSTGFTWVLDPIDGTRGYISGTPTWGTLIALNHKGTSIFGIIDQPYINERFSGGFDEKLFSGPFGEKNLGVSKVKELRKAVLFSTYPEIGSKTELEGFKQVAKYCKLTRYGLDCYAYGLLALGHIDIIVEAGLKAYDVQAPIAVIKAAGGNVTNWIGGPAEEGGRVLATCNSQLHSKALNILKLIT